jgi:hypothetical protein
LALTPRFKAAEPVITGIVRTLEAIYVEMNEHPDTFHPSHDALWGVLVVMLSRIHAHVEAALVAFITGSSESAAVVSRTIIEMSISLLYILRNDQEKDSYVRYCADYLKEEGERLRRWEKAATRLDATTRARHMSSIVGGKTALDKMRTALESGFLEIRAPSMASVKPWPNAFDRFDALGLDVKYRTLYAALSSDVHGDAGVIVTYFTVAAAGDESKVRQLESALSKDRGLSLSTAIRYYQYAAARYAERFHLKEAIVEIDSAKVTVGRALEGLFGKLEEDANDRSKK